MGPPSTAPAFIGAVRLRGISDVDWDTKDGHYRVLLHGEWINVPNSSIVTEPNRYGPAVVWPYMDSNGTFTFDVSCLEPEHKACAWQ